MPGLFEEYDDIIKSSDRQQQLKTSLYTSADSNPDQEAGFIKLSRKTGIPVEALRNDNGAEARRRATALPADGDVMTAAPVTTSFLSDPANARIAHDDIDNLSGMERTIAEFLRPTRDFIRRVGSTMAEAPLVPVAMGRGLNKLLSPVVDFGTGAYDTAEAYWQPIVKKWQQALATPEPRGVMENVNALAAQGVGGGLKLLPALPFGVTGMATAGGLESYDKSGDLLAAVTDAAKSAVAMRMMAATKGLGTVKAVGGVAGVSGVDEFVTSLVRTGGNVDESLKAGAQAAVQMAAMDAFNRGLAPHGGKLFEELYTNARKSGLSEEVSNNLASLGQMEFDAFRLNKGRGDYQALSTLAEQVKASKLNTRMPEKLQELLDGVGQEHDVKDVFVPVDRLTTLWQEAGLDPTKEAAAVFSDPERYFEAVATGGDVAIPLSEFAVKLAGKGYFQELLKDSRLSPVDMTMREIEELDKSYPEQLRQAKEQAGTLDVAEQPSWTKVYDDVFGQLLGIYPRDTAEKYAVLAASRARTRAERLGVDPFELYNESPLRIVRPLPDELKRKTVDTGIDPLLDRLRVDDIPTDENVFGPTLLQFLRGRGIQDSGGDLAAMDINAATRKPGQRNILRSDGLPLDKAREAAVEAGYLGAGATVRDLLDSIDKELRGTAVHSGKPMDDKAFELQATLNQLKEELDKRGIDLGQAGNEEVRRRLFQGFDYYPERGIVAAEGGVTYVSDNLSTDKGKNYSSDRTATEGLDGNVDAGAEAREQLTLFLPEGSKPQEIAPPPEDAGGDLVKKVATGTIHSSITRISSPADAAHIAFPLARRAQEALIAIVTDKKGKVLGVIQHTTGSLNSSIVSPRDLLGVVHDFPGAAEVWFAHNHPSGDPMFSREDRDITDRLAALLDGSGIKSRGMIAVGMSGGAAWTEGSRGKSDGITLEELKADSRRTRKITTFDREMVKLAGGDRLTSSTLAFEFINSLGPETSGVIIVNGKNVPVSFIPMTIEEMQKLKTGDPATGSSAIMQAFHKGNGAAMIVTAPEIGSNQAAMKNMGAFGNVFGGRVLDFIDSKNGNSAATSGLMPSFGETFYQDSGKRRGFFLPDSRTIGILEHADLSTFIHELGHSWLEELRLDASRPDAPEQLRQDWETVRAWLGIEEGDISREGHEQFAKATEAYLSEGKAPSAELKGVFQRFSLWLKQIYRNLTGTGVKLTDAGREVFDRLLATDEEIARAQDDSAQKPLFLTAEAAGMTPREFEAYRASAEAGGEAARSKLSAQIMDELRREHEEWWKAERAKVFDEVMQEAQSEPVYAALQEILKGKDFEGNPTPGLKMSRAALVAMYGEEFLKRLPRGSATEYIYAADGVSPELVAERYGFSSADEMIRRMIEAPRMKRFVTAETDMRMKERYGDMRLDGSLADEALKAVHNDHWADVLRAEIRALRKKAAEVKPFVDAAMKGAQRERQAAQETIPAIQVFREAARQQIGEKPVMDISPQLYLNAERKAAREAFELNGKGEFAAAAEARTKQLLNHFLYFEAAKARTEAAEVMKYAKKLATAKELGKLGLAGQPFLDQMRAILNRYEFIQLPLSDLQERRETIQQFLDRLRNDEGVDLPIPPEVADELQKPVNYRQLTMNELRSVRDSLKMIEHAAKLVNRVKRDNQAVEIGRAEGLLVQALQTAIPERGSRIVNDTTLSFLGKVKEKMPEIDIPVVRPEFQFERMDGHKSSGVWHDFFWNQYNEASNHQNRLRQMVFPTIFELTRGKGIDRSKGPVYIKGLGGSLSKDDIVAIALNSGNESNLDKLMRGGIRFRNDALPIELKHETLQEILSHLTADEIKVVNGIWRAIESLKPEAALLARKRTGIEPVWIEAKPMEVANGTLEGGYFPLRYDTRYSAVGEKQADTSTLDQMFTKYAPASTRQGYMKERTRFAAPLSLDWQAVTTRHLDEVITDISHWEFATQAQRLLKRAGVKETIIDRLGEPSYKNLLDWVRYTVNQDVMGREASDTIEKLRRSIRTKASTYILGFKVGNAVADMLISAPLAMQRLELKNIVRGSFEYMRSPKTVHRFAAETSEYMKNLDLEIDRNLTEAMNELAGKHTVADDVRRWAIESRVWAYKIAATMGWISGYREAQAKGLDGKEAVRYADKVSRMTQDAGRAGDLSAVERNPNMRELTMYIGPTLIQYNNMADAGRRMADLGASRKTVANAAKVFMFGYIANAILYEVLRGRQPDDKEKFLTWFLARMGLGIFDGIPIGRDLAGYAEGRIVGEPGKMLRNIPVMEAGKTAVDAANATLKAAKGEGETRTAVKQSVKAVGAWTGLPALQATTTGEYLFDALTGEYSAKHPWSPASDILYYRRGGK